MGINNLEISNDLANDISSEIVKQRNIKNYELCKT